MKYILKKIASLVITLFIISFVTFFAFLIIPGDAALKKLGLDVEEEQLEQLREQMGLNENFAVRYGKWLKGAVKGNFGTSLEYNRPVSELVAGRLSPTIGLAVISLILILLIAIPLSIISAGKPNGPLDHTITVITQVGMAVPQFFLGIMLSFVFGILLSWFNVGGYVKISDDFFGFVRFMILPAIAVAVPKSAMMIKFLRDCIVAEKKNDYVRTAKAKGNTERGILVKHILKNAIISSITFFAMVAAEVLAGSIVVEQVFSIPGLGRLLVTSISNRDYPVVSAIIMYMATLVVVTNTLADTAYRAVDPRLSRN